MLRSDICVQSVLKFKSYYCKVCNLEKLSRSFNKTIRFINLTKSCLSSIFDTQLFLSFMIKFGHLSSFANLCGIQRCYIKCIVINTREEQVVEQFLNINVKIMTYTLQRSMHAKCKV